MILLRDDSQVEGLSRFFKIGPGQYGEGVSGIADKATIEKLKLIAK